MEVEADRQSVDSGTHTLRHSYARHLLVHGVPISYRSHWLGHSSIQTTLIYLELVPGPYRESRVGAVTSCELAPGGSQIPSVSKRLLPE